MFLLVVWIPHKKTPSRVWYITLLGVWISDATLHLLFNRSQSYELVRSEGVRRKMVSVHLHESWVLGSLWWLDQERKQHGRQFAVCMINFGQIFYILTTSAHANSNNGDRRRRSFSFGYIYGDFLRNGRVFRLVLQRTTRLSIQTFQLTCVVLSRNVAGFLGLNGTSTKMLSFTKKHMQIAPFCINRSKVLAILS